MAEEKRKTVKAIWQDQVLAESDETLVIEGNYYFPPKSVNKKFFKDSDTHSTCPWKGEASYYTVEVDGEENPDAAWYYPKPKAGSKEIVGDDFSNYVAFWHGVEVS